jgi:putative ABC transport system substrate-binding protein
MRSRSALLITLAFALLAAPLAAEGQQGERVRRIAVLMHLPESDREGQDRFDAFRRELRRLGWIDGQNMKLDTRWGASDSDRRRHAAELVALAPDVVLASTSLAMVALQPVTSTVPIVFSNVADPVGAGFVPSLAQPRGNVTGFTPFDYTISAKWLELLKERAARDPRDCHPRSNESGRDRAVRRDPERRPIIRNGSIAGRCG